MKVLVENSILNSMEEGMILRRPMKDWAEDERPREKLAEKGRNALSNAELLAIVLRTGTKQMSALHLARLILDSVDNDLAKLSRKSIQELQKFPGVGQAKAAEISAVMELVRRRQQSKSAKRMQVKCSSDIFYFMRPYFHDLHHEEFYVIYLNRASYILKVVQLSKGGIAGTVADGKLIFKYGLLEEASGLILVHNHPSGNATPSPSDIQLTHSLKTFGAHIDFQVLDHLIIAGNNYFSFADEGKL